ncbi:DUF1446-domain-containing protein [Cucurbitaria berberidis CBS 394.84]|uniref:DUF1446-domain-containing protein n=1 Tax=Cucurbitaria berberidis CBS 394.84 TaxID=1168544 RepID=A0A9P4GKL5_9PLEO|nr:DUF1446-domain-containing protein [Cucurbitaria berberidis CBS 394.84]KAF1847066.1 DUF1446-domain-containing protein [Cucurbitaria berberidis CBS 394.84]
MAPAVRRPVRVGGASGGFSDRVRAISSLAKDDVDVIVGDWLSEMTMTMHGTGKIKNKEQMLQARTFEDKLNHAMFAENFMDCFTPAIEDIATRGIKLCVNAGASDTELLAQLVDKTCRDAGHPLKVAWIEGDDVTGTVKNMLNKGEGFKSLMHNRSVAEWGLEPVCAQCYLGGLGIARALTEGADIVIAGRVSDASPIIGAAAWWHDWTNDQFDELAGSLVIGHLLECAAYVSGGYCSDFRSLLAQGKHINMGFPICAINNKGEGVMYKEKNTGGCMTVSSVTSQLLYEIQGPLYYNCDVTANLEGIKIEQIGEDQVKVSGVKGLPPPPTTKVGITGFAGWQAEYHIYLVGLHMEEKCRWIEEQIRYELGEELIKKFDVLKFMQNGSSVVDSRNQDVATVDFRVFAQSKDREILNMRNPKGFFRISMVNFLMSCPGASLGNDVRQAEGKPYYEYHPSLLPQAAVQQRAHLIWEGEEKDGFKEGKKVIDVPLAPEFREYDRQQPSYETTNPVDLSYFGPTVRLPLGSIVLGRSGDKCSDANVGLFVRNDDEWEWLRSLLTIEKIKELLGPEEFKGKPVDRFEMPNVRAVHFLLHDHLDRGYDACSTYDTLGKNVCEYLRAKTVDIPVQFVKRGVL